MIILKSYSKKFLLSVISLVIGLLFIRLIMFPRWLDSSELGTLLIFLISTGDFVDPDHEYLHQPDSLEGVTLFGTAHYLRDENESEWSYVSTGGLFKTIEDATPAGLKKLGWNREDDKFEATYLWTSKVILPPVLMMNEPDNYFTENIEDEFHAPVFLITEAGGVQLDAWLKYEGIPTTQFQYRQERFVYDKHGNLIERKIIARN